MYTECSTNKCTDTVYMYTCVCVIEFRFFNQITKKEEEEEHCNLVKITFMNITHILHPNYIGILIGVNFYGDFHLDVELTESESWNFLNYGRIGKMQSLYTKYVLPYLVIHAVL